jgi:hypothetical protein
LIARLGESTAWDEVVDMGMILEFLPQVGKTPVKPGRSVPIKRSSRASFLRASEEAWNRLWYASLG